MILHLKLIILIAVVYCLVPSSCFASVSKQIYQTPISSSSKRKKLKQTYRIEHFLWKLKKSNSAFNSELVITTPRKNFVYMLNRIRFKYTVN